MTTESDLERFVGYNLKRAYVVVLNDFRRALGDGGLNARAFSALSLIVQQPSISQSELARQLGIERSGLVAIVDDLEQRRYVMRNPVPDDRRAYALIATNDGKSAYSKALALVEAHENALLSHMSDREINTLIKLLKKVRFTGDTA